MRVSWGLDAAKRKSGITEEVVQDLRLALNGHTLITGGSGSGKTYQLRSLINQLTSSANQDNEPVPRFHVLDIHGDIEVPGASTVLFSEQTQYGLAPLRINPDPHYGGVRKRVQAFSATINRVMRSLGPKQEAVLRNLLIDIYDKHGFKMDDSSTWAVDPHEAQMLTDGTGTKFYVDVPIDEKDEAKAVGARWDPQLRAWYVPSGEYAGAITRWPPKWTARTHPGISDVLRLARNILAQKFLGTGMKAVTALEAANRAASALQRKQIESLRKVGGLADAEQAQGDLEKAKTKAIEAYTEYVSSIATGGELEALIKYDSVDILKSVIDRLENLQAIGIFKPEEPPFDPSCAVWRYNLKPLSMTERKLFVLFRLEQIFLEAVQRGEQQHILDVIILDEAHAFADDDPENPINTIAKEARKFGVMLVAASQSPTHFPEDFIASVATKVILGIDEMYWRGAVTKMRVEESALKWVKQQRSMLVQIKSRGQSKNEWRWVVIDR